MYIEYLDNLPQIPVELLDNLDNIRNLPKQPTAMGENNPRFQTRVPNAKLIAWLSENFKFPFKCQYQIISPEIRIHKDNGRAVAYNYILELGGADVTTSVYDDDKTTVLQSEIIPLHKWHRLNVSKFHGVHNIDVDKFRISISVFPQNN
jgi:hypothetical protein